MGENSLKSKKDVCATLVFIIRKLDRLYVCPVTASPKKVTSNNTGTPGRQIDDRGGEDEEDYSDEEVHSDDEFNFVDDKQTLNGMRISSVGTGTGSFSVRFEGCEQPPSPASIASSVQSEDFVGKTNFRVDDFARMLSEFKGFGSSPPAPSIPEPPQIPLVEVNDPGATSDEGRETGTGSNDESTGSASTISGQASGSGSETGDFRVRLKSVGEHVGLNESQAAAQGITLKKNESLSSMQQAESKPETKKDAGNQLTTGDAAIPSYVEVLDDSQASVKSPEVIYDSPRLDDSYNVFERSQMHASKVAGKLTTPKVENLKPRLPFPVLLISAGEGYVDLRRKRPSENDKEPRIMIWQIS